MHTHYKFAVTNEDTGIYDLIGFSLALIFFFDNKQAKILNSKCSRDQNKKSRNKYSY